MVQMRGVGWGGGMHGFSCESVWRHVHLKHRTAPGPLHVHTPLLWLGPVSLPQGISRPLPDFLCHLLFKSPALHMQQHEKALDFVFTLAWSRHCFWPPWSIHIIVDIVVLCDAIYHLCLWPGL